MGTRTSDCGTAQASNSTANAAPRSSRFSYLRRWMASASAPPCRYGALASANRGGCARQCGHRRGFNAGSSDSSWGTPHTGHPAGTGTRVSAQTAQKGDSPGTSHDAQRSGKTRSRTSSARRRSGGEMDPVPATACTEPDSSLFLFDHGGTDDDYPWHQGPVQSRDLAVIPAFGFRQHSPHRREKAPGLDPEEVRGGRLQFLQRRREQLDASARLVLHERLVPRRGDLDEALHEQLWLVLELEPKLFPRLVRPPMQPAVEQVSSARQRRPGRHFGAHARTRLDFTAAPSSAIS